jgi:hypothetical protein
MVMMTQPMAVSLALGPVPAMAVRILWDLPHASGRWLASSPRPRIRDRRLITNHVAVPGAGRDGRAQFQERAMGHKGMACGRYGHALACSSL